MVENHIYHGDVADFYGDWESPIVIISDGAYGVDGFDSDPRSPRDLADWYEPHINQWAEAATAKTTLWIWNTELGWATIHPILEEYGWKYRGANIWNKGMQHIAGNCNTQTMRKFPQVSEVCVQYVWEEIELSSGAKRVRDWLRDEWERAGLALQEANKACGVADAASRKYFATDDQWYPPPQDQFKKLKEYANEHGDPKKAPYFELPEELQGIDPDDLTVPCAKFDLPTGVTNVWDDPPVDGKEREWDTSGGATHPNQKRIDHMERIIRVSSDEEDLVWEPFAGLGTGSVAAARLNRTSVAAETNEEYYEIAKERLEKAGNAGQQATFDDWER